MGKGPKSKPIHRERYGVISRYRIPHEGPLTPGLRKDGSVTQVIGFTASLFTEQELEKEEVNGSGRHNCCTG